jgi:drug/metabolite transporter (DMT)-like permease
MLSEIKRSPGLISGCFLSALGQVTLFAALSFAPTIYVVPTYSLKSLVTVILAYAVIPKSERINTRVILGAILAIAGIVNKLRRAEVAAFPSPSQIKLFHRPGCRD